MDSLPLPPMQEEQPDQGTTPSNTGPKSKRELDEEQKKFKAIPWLRGRLALSEQAARYELPMDLLSLETMTPEQYMRSFTRIAAKRQQIYNKVFMNNKNKTSTITFSELDKAVGDVLITTFDKNKHLPLILETTRITEETKIDLQLFSSICALAERLLYPNFVTEDTENLPEFKRDHLEIADFQHLAWKLHDVNVNPDMHRLLERINQQPLKIAGRHHHHNKAASKSNTSSAGPSATQATAGGEGNNSGEAATTNNKQQTEN